MDIRGLIDEFLKLYGGSEEGIRVFRAPGRVNLIGEHTDYNGGFVFPAAITMSSTLIVRKRCDNIIRLKATTLDVMVEADAERLDSYRNLEWGNYQIGVAYEMKQAGYEIFGMDMLYHDTVPHGGGLSSSAAIEVSTALCIANFSNEKNGAAEPINMIDIARISQRAESEYCGVKCGIMDQFASAMGKKDNAIFLKCDDLSYEYVPLNLDGKRIIISNTGVKHALGASKYNERRKECEAGFAGLKSAMQEKNSLGEISPDEFERYAHLIDNEVVRRRIKHVVTEDNRVERSVKALKDGDIELFGKLMYESHASLRDDYEVTCKELDIMVEEAQKVDGVLGSRMTGAGFGGCTVSIVEESAVDEFIEKVGEGYEKRVGIKPKFYVTQADNGGHEITEF